MHWGYIYRKDILLEIGGWNEKLVVAEDKEIARRIMQAGYEIHLIPVEADIHHSSGIYESWTSMLRRNFFFGRMHGSQKPQVNKFPWRIFFVIFGGFSFLVIGILFNSLTAILIGFVILLLEYTARLLWYAYWGWRVVDKKYLLFLPIFGMIIYVPYLLGRIIGMIRRQNS
jgi:GT2 family glycosyltransferase